MSDVCPNGICKKCIKYGSNRRIVLGGDCSSTQSRAKETRTNIWKYGNKLKARYLTTNSKKFSKVNQICIHEKNYFNKDASGWLSMLGENSGGIKLKLTNESGSSGYYKVLSSEKQSYDHRGFSFIYKLIYGDDASINQIVIYRSSINPTFILEQDGTDDDDLVINDLTGSDIISFVVLYGDDDEAPIGLTLITNFVNAYIDNVIYNGSEVATIQQMRNNFDAKFNTISDGLTLYNNFEYPGLNNSYIELNGAVGTGLQIELSINQDHKYVITTIHNYGTNYNDGEIIGVTGIDGAVGSEYDAIFTVHTGESGPTGATTVDVTGMAYVYKISDGGDDQYDGGNILNNDFTTRIQYTQGEIVDDVFGVGSKYFTFYKNSIFAMAVTGNLSDSFYLDGNLGADGYGDFGGGRGISNSICSTVKFVSGSGGVAKNEKVEVNILPN